MGGQLIPGGPLPTPAQSTSGGGGGGGGGGITYGMSTEGKVMGGGQLIPGGPLPTSAQSTSGSGFIGAGAAYGNPPPRVPYSDDPQPEKQEEQSKEGEGEAVTEMRGEVDLLQLSDEEVEEVGL